MLDVTRDFDPRRAAILEAADQIERHPEEFDYNQGACPQTVCGAPACALAWIGYFAAIDAALGYCGDVAAWLGVPMEMPFNPEGTFYRRLDRIAGATWHCDAQLCAWALRRYADMYHPVKVYVGP